MRGFGKRLVKIALIFSGSSYAGVAQSVEQRSENPTQPESLPEEKPKPPSENPEKPLVPSWPMLIGFDPVFEFRRGPENFLIKRVLPLTADVDFQYGIIGSLALKIRSWIWFYLRDRKTKNTREIEDSIVDGFMLVEELVYTCKRDELVLGDRFICREISLIERDTPLHYNLLIL